MIFNLYGKLLIILISIAGAFSTVEAMVQITITPISSNIQITLDSTGNKTLSITDLALITGTSGSAIVVITPSTLNCTRLGNQPINVHVQDGANSAEINITVTVNAGIKILYPVGLLKIPTYGCAGLLPDLSRIVKVSTSCGGKVTISQSMPPGTYVTTYLNDTVFVWLRARDDYGNTDSVMVKALADITVPLPTILITTPTTAICSGSPATFTKTVTGLDYGYGNWRLNGKDIENAYKGTYTFSDLKDGDKISYVIPISCAGYDSSNIVKMSVYPSKIPDVHILATDTVLCPGDLLHYKAALSLSIPGLQYEWSLNGKTTVVTDSVFQSTKLKNGDILSCEITGNSPCLGAFIHRSSDYVIVINPVILPSIMISTVKNSVCKGSPISFDAQITRGIKSVLTWRINGLETAYHSTTTPLVLNDGDQVDCILSSPQSCSPPVLSNKITVIVNDLPMVSLPAALYIPNGKSTTLNPSVSGNISSYLWMPTEGLNDPYLKNPIAKPDKTTIYMLTVTSADGCTSAAEITVNVTAPILVIPSAFTPNNDGINDTWHIPGILAYPNCKVSIFNRNGQLIFFSAGYYSDWNGTYKGALLPFGVYYYVIQPDLSDQSTTLSGSVTIIR